jgi:hypothetical protein
MGRVKLKLGILGGHMKIKSISAIVISSLFASCITFANTKAQPSACPDPSAIKSRGLNYAVVLRDDNNIWQAAWLPSDNYQTEQEWVFYMGGGRDDPATDETEAMNKANAALQTLSLFQGPLNDNKQWLCYYLTSGKTAAIAITPPDSSFRMTKIRG